MIHERVDIERWSKLFPLESLRKEAREFVESRRKASPHAYKNKSEVERHVKLMSPGGEIVTSPHHLAVVEQLRAEWLGGGELPGFPTDVFVFGRGEPPDRSVTKAGGLPFWPKARSWPAGKSGRPLNFVAQFCFADSSDLYDSLPGDVLIVFADGRYGEDWTEGDVGALRFEWVNRSESRLVESGDIPPSRWELLPVYGEIHRTKDYLTGGAWEPAWWALLLKKSKNPHRFLHGLGARRALETAYHGPWRIAVIEGTKIGGIPRWIQPAEKIPGRFLCSLGSVDPAYQIVEEIRRPYPFTNFEAPLIRRRRGFRSEEEEIDADRLLMWGDAGSLFLFLDDDGRIHWTIQCY
jgi:hypothetical protein